MKWHCYRISMLPIKNKPLLLTEQKPVPSKNFSFTNPRTSTRKEVIRCFLRVTLIFFSLTCADSSKTTSQNVSKVKILIRYCVLLWCGAVFVWKRNVRASYMIDELVIITAIYHGEQQVLSIQYPHTNDNLLVLRREEMTEICNKCIDGNLKYCDISKSINKTI